MLIANASSGGVDLVTALVLLLTALRWPLRIILIPIVIARHRPSEALAWLAILFFEPFIGLVIYAIVGRSPTSQKRIKRRREIIASVRTPERLEELRKFNFELDKVEYHHRDLVSFAEELARMPVARGNSAKIYSDTTQLMKKIAEAIDAAEHHVHVMTFILVNDAAARIVLDAVLRAAERGVTCRILADHIGSKRFIAEHACAYSHANIEIRESLPAGILRTPFERFDVRNHRKLIVVDGSTAFAGSHNLVQSNYGTDRYGEWHDLTAELRGPIALQLQQVFLEDWAGEGSPIEPTDEIFPTPERVGKVPMLTVPSGPGDRHDAARQLFITMINEANDRIVVTSPYMVPDEPALLALQLAARRGVRVDIIVPAKSNHPIVHFAAGGFYDELAEAGVFIHRHQHGLVHAKTITCDEEFCVLGSANFDRRSFDLNYEMSVFMIGKEITTKVRAQQERYIAESVALDLDEWRSRPKLRVFAENCAKLFGPLL